MVGQEMLLFSSTPPHAFSSLHLHKLQLPRRHSTGRIQSLDEHVTQLTEIDRLSDIAVEPGLDALGIHIAEDVGRQSDNRQMPMMRGPFPATDLFAGLVAVFDWHE
jgi:hypothetical protein